MEITINGRILRLVEGDIADQAVDAVVNAANQHLQLGSGVAGAIRRKGGPAIQQECDRIGYCPVGGAVITGGGRLKARFVIHAVGPLGSDPQADHLLESATRASLQVAAERSLSSLAFPAISTGVFGFPIERCAAIMLSTTIGYLAGADEGLGLVVFCLFGKAAYDVFAAELAR
jgi:O-acetyl-ADP-ribose deacetylase (regulator of RNase III)